MVCRPEELKHKHHIIPRYMGGSDDASNLVEVSVTCHAMFHYCNYKLWGNWEDEVAWYGLSGRISSEEITRLAISKAQTGESNSQYGTRWIYSVEKRQCYRIHKDEKLPDGFRYGRVDDFSDCDECIGLFKEFDNGSCLYLRKFIRDKKIKNLRKYIKRIKIFVDKKEYDQVLERKKKERKESSPVTPFSELRKTYVKRYNGVHLTASGKYQVQVSVGGKKKCFGSYPTPEEAARIYNREALKIHGEKAKLNLDID